MNMHPLVSVVIPNFNGEKTVLNTIGSVYEQGVKDLDIVLVDDCSTDGSVEAVQKAFPDVKVVKCERKAYAAGARNIGLKNALGKYLLFIDNDVTLLPGALELLVKRAETYDIAYPQLTFENGVPFHPASQEQREYPMISGVFMISRDAAERINRAFGEFFDEFYRIYWEDYEFFLRCRLLGLTASFVPEANASHVLKTFSFAGKENRFYLEFRNFLYSCLKYRNVHTDSAFSGRRSLKHALKFLCVNALLNYSGSERFQSTERADTLGKKARLAVFHSPVTNKTQIYLFYLTLKAARDALAASDKAMAKNRVIKSTTFSNA